MKNRPSRFLVAVAFLFALGGPILAQDHVRGSAEAIVAAIDPARLTYDLLVDGDLPQDDAAQKRLYRGHRRLDG